MAPPVGMKLPNGFSVGGRIGSGAFGAVHAVVRGRKETEWCVKLTPVPKKKTLKGNSKAEIPYNRLWSEKLLYTSHYRNHCGSFLPQLPSTNDKLPIFLDNHNGYRILFMERMECGLVDALKTLTNTNDGTIDVGPIARKLLTIVETVHTTSRYLILDVKTENLMVCRASKKTIPLAERIRLVDLGLFRTYGGAYGHAPNDGVGDVQGTAMYASLNVHDLQTPSRRDDIEAMLYVVGEIVIRVTAAVQGTAGQYEPDNSYLPWSLEESDAALGEVKSRNVSNIKSEYYRRMPTKVAETLHKCFLLVRKLRYTDEPEYDRYKDLVKSLKIPVPTKKKATKKQSTKRPAAARTPPAADSGRRRRRSATRYGLMDDSDEESPPKAHKTEEPDLMDVEVGTFYSAVDAAVANKPEVVNLVDSDENSKPAAKSKKVLGIKLVVHGPNNFKQTVYLTEASQSIIFGSNPTNNSGLTVQVPTDPNLRDCHVKLTLSSAGHRGVEVEDLSKGHTTVEKSTVPRSGTMCFVNQDIQCGGTVVEVLTLNANDMEVVAEQASTKPAASTRSRRTTRAMAATQVDDAPAKKPAPRSSTKKSSVKPSKKVRSVVIRLRGKADEWTLEEGVCETLIVGSSKPSGKSRGKGHFLELAVAGVEPNHARLDLNINNGVVMVKVTDLKSGAQTFHDKKLIAKGMNSMAFAGDDIQIGDAVLEIRKK